MADSSDGFVALFTGDCPTGWSELSYAQGRMLLLVNNSDQAGEEFGFALADGEDRAHTHVVAGSFNFPSKHVSALGGLNTDGAKQGSNGTCFILKYSD